MALIDTINPLRPPAGPRATAGWSLKDYEARGGYAALKKILAEQDAARTT
jgi:NADH-quinone oxidoreductase subunit F